MRGGGEMGRAWYEDGKYLKKKNTFLDFIACAEFLIKGKYTSPSRLAINGASAGGMLIGAVCNMRPDLFHAAVLGVSSGWGGGGDGERTTECWTLGRLYAAASA